MCTAFGTQGTVRFRRPPSANVGIGGCESPQPNKYLIYLPKFKGPLERAAFLLIANRRRVATAQDFNSFASTEKPDTATRNLQVFCRLSHAVLPSDPRKSRR